MEFKDRVKNRREALGLSQAELAEIMGYKSRASINKIEKGERNLKQSQLVQLAKALHTTPLWLLGVEKEESSRMQTPNRIPVYGSVPAGIPIEAIQDIVDWEDIPMDWLRGGKQYLAFRVKGDSMYPEYLDGDTIIVLRQPDCNSGDDCVVYVNGYDATLKRVIKQQFGIVLQPLNPAYEPQFFDYNDENRPISILGVVVELRRKKH